jgi:hypothetical protein
VYDKRIVSELPEDRQPPVPVPHDSLDRDTLLRVIEAFVLREGTDYGAVEFSLEQKVRHVLRQLEGGDAQIVFDPNTESIDIVTERVAARIDR